MKTLLRCLLFGLVAAAPIATVLGSPAAALSVVVRDASSGATVHQGTADAKGNFKTKKLHGGPYIIELKSAGAASRPGDLKVALGGIKGEAKQKAISGGLALTVVVEPNAEIKGRVTTNAPVAAGPKSVPAGMEKVRANVKIMNGKQYVWVAGPIGSNIGGKWVEVGTEGAAISTSNKKGEDAEALRRIQEMHDGGRAQLYPDTTGGGRGP